ncbi:hypothetical protein PLESTB_001130400 [Pleodorina starrii]|uniref:Thioredoxin domain-containing protein n=1 Tax=Pleodorina starrii TaxID=330485 RepID=A0A9W6BSE1_9CHLO|nr:hypothetical protein PLESTM_001367800 [Pleodorina starrii]GLC56646.1 hypothetical protein PLESTB_001130400 [Pleodorina starrii]GLC69033.1 hypothetical protein PLESTF_000772300 [Pleodorina starrii]
MHALKRSCKSHCTGAPVGAPRTAVCARLFQTSSIATRVGVRQALAHAPRPARLHDSCPPVVVCQAGRASGEPWWLKDNPPNMKDINSIQELVDALSDAGDRLVIVEYYAQWCNACRALFPKICKIMAENPDVLFLKVNFDDNRDACRTLAVKVLPYFHLYRGAEGRVAAFSCTISKLQIFKDALENFSSPFCSLEPTPGLAEFPAIIAHPELHPEEAAAAAAASLTSSSEEEEMHPLADTPTVVA